METTQKRSLSTFITQSDYQNQLKGVSSLKSSLANAVRCLNQWILAPKPFSGYDAFHSRILFLGGSLIWTGRFGFSLGAVKCDDIPKNFPFVSSQWISL